MRGLRVAADRELQLLPYRTKRKCCCRIDLNTKIETPTLTEACVPPSSGVAQVAGFNSKSASQATLRLRSRLQLRVMIAASSRFEVPRAKSDFTRRSSETVGSPASILATLDWLERSV